jgi:hypothetical protein
VGRTIPSYRIALELEIVRWKSFRDALDNENREAFDKLMDKCRSFAMASGSACNPIIFEPMTISILLAQEIKLLELEHELQDLLWQKTSIIE